jgi:outer membrane lipoprotein SlyB
MTAYQHSSSESIVLQERIRQAQWGFNLSVTFVGISGLITLAGLVVSLTGHGSPGAYTATAGGAAATAVCGRLIKLSSEANDRLDQMMKEQDDEDPK